MARTSKSIDTTSWQETKAADNWQRYEYGRHRGHKAYCETAAKLEGFYLGGGEQWSAADKAILDEQNRPWQEFNLIMPGVNGAVGYQIANRLDIAFRPRGGGADHNTAVILNKLVKHLSDKNKLHWKETQVFSDGMIEQRGYFQFRMNFDRNIFGDIQIDELDPRDVMPDPDAKTADPDDWSDCIVTRWLTYDQIEQRYGKKARQKAEERNYDESDFGDMDDDDEERNKFGDDNSGLYDAYWGNPKDAGNRRVRIIDRQINELTMSRVAIWGTGDVRTIDNSTDEQIASYVADGAVLGKRMMRRVRWVVSAYDTVLHDQMSPYNHINVIPFFAYFRRGKTRGMIDNAVSPQEALNKALSQYVHVINTTANSGWMIEEGSLVTPSPEQLESSGSKTGLVIVYAKDAKNPPVKIQSNRVPEGIDRVIERSSLILKEVTTPDAMRGTDEQDISGIAIQSRQFASQQQLAVPLDNLGRTRNLLASRILELIQQFYTTERVIRITETDPLTGRESEQEYVLNQFDPETGSFINDLTIGEYDVVISEQPMQVTFENSQFEQVMEMRKVGVQLPDTTVVRYSHLADKQEIVEQMAKSGEQRDPKAEAEAELIKAKAEHERAMINRTKTEKVNKSVESQYSAIQTAQAIAQIPAISPLADALLLSAGYDDQNQPPIVPVLDQAGLQEVPPPAPNTNPLTPTNPVEPDNPAVGMNEGIEGGGDPNLVTQQPRLPAD